MTSSALLLRTRFGRLSPASACSIVSALLLLIAAGLWSGVAPAATDPATMTAGEDTSHGDLALYRKIIGDVAKGQSYYAAVATEYRRWNYPLKPVFAVRTPVLATAMAALPNDTARALSLRLLVITVFAAWGWRLWHLFRQPVVVGAGLLLLGCGLVPGLIPGAYAFHEVWAGDLIALSLAVYDPRRWWPSVLIGLMAVVLRELSLPYLLAMGALALFEGRKREALAWAATVGCFLAIFAIHAHVLAGLVHPDDKVSVSWLHLGGWSFVLSSSKWNTLLSLAPSWLVAAAVPLMLLGLVGWPGPLGMRLAAICLGYCLLFLGIGRLQNFYWGLLVAPLMGLGLLTGPRGLWDLARSLWAAHPGEGRTSSRQSNGTF